MFAPSEISGADSAKKRPGPIPARWYAVYCQPHRERSAAQNLLKQGFDTFLPLRRKIHRHAGKIEAVSAPLFPGYLFVRLDIALHRWRCVNGTYGVIRLVMQGERPSPMP